MSASLTLPDVENATGVAPCQSVPAPRIAGVGTAVAGEPYSQRDLLEIFRITDSRVRSVFLNSAIERRYLSLPPAGHDGGRACEEQGDLLAKHRALALIIHRGALGVGPEPADV
jgi:polyketide synthase Type III